MYFLLGFVLSSSCLAYIGGASGFGFGPNWLLYIGVPLIIGIWAQIRVKSAFSHWSKVRASGNITGAECAREILQAAQIQDVDVVETNDFLGDHYDPTKKQLHLSSNVYNTPSVAALGISAHECGHAIQHARAYAPLKWRMAIVPVTMIALTGAAVRYHRWFVLPNHRSDHARHLVLFDSPGVSTDYVARGVRCLAARENHSEGNGDHTARGRSGGRKQSAERRRAYLYRGVHCCTGQFALVDVDPRPALIDRST